MEGQNLTAEPELRKREAFYQNKHPERVMAVKSCCQQILCINVNKHCHVLGLQQTSLQMSHSYLEPSNNSCKNLMKLTPLFLDNQTIQQKAGNFSMMVVVCFVIDVHIHMENLWTSSFISKSMSALKSLPVFLTASCHLQVDLEYFLQVGKKHQDS